MCPCQVTRCACMGPRCKASARPVALITTSQCCSWSKLHSFEPQMGSTHTKQNCQSVLQACQQRGCAVSVVQITDHKFSRAAARKQKHAPPQPQHLQPATAASIVPLSAACAPRRPAAQGCAALQTRNKNAPLCYLLPPTSLEAAALRWLCARERPTSRAARC